ncbi:sodium/potassium/calcium exchanger Nckx30C-like isoform X4 [Vespula squamosa]|uniref:Sodium/potassium/calcium exchanger Nckx30C-like isoform X4 n=1 Tax=Vespula squamosa TaxID=30214 RepID=A0ABD2ATV9_VESSQ
MPTYKINIKQHPNATNSSETSVGGVSGACGSSGMPGTGDAGCSSSRGGSSSGAGGGAGTIGQGCEQVSSSHSTRESHAKFRHGLLQLMIHTIDPLHDGQSRAVIYLLNHVSIVFDLNEITIKLTGLLSSECDHFQDIIGKVCNAFMKFVTVHAIPLCSSLLPRCTLMSSSRELFVLINEK